MSLLWPLDQQLRGCDPKRGSYIEDRTDVVFEEAVAFNNISKPGKLEGLCALDG